MLIAGCFIKFFKQVSFRITEVNSSKFSIIISLMVGLGIKKVSNILQTCLILDDSTRAVNINLCVFVLSFVLQ